MNTIQKVKAYEEIPWDKFPEATHYTPVREGHCAAFWRVVGDKSTDVWVLNTFHTTTKIEHYTESFSTEWKTVGIERPKQQGKFMKVEQVYRTEDGEVFDNFEEARQHSIEFSLWDAVKQEFGCYGGVQLEHYSDFKELLTFIEDKQKELEVAV